MAPEYLASRYEIKRKKRKIKKKEKKRKETKKKGKERDVRGRKRSESYELHARLRSRSRNWKRCRTWMTSLPKQRRKRWMRFLFRFSNMLLLTMITLITRLPKKWKKRKRVTNTAHHGWGTMKEAFFFFFLLDVTEKQVHAVSLSLIFVFIRFIAICKRVLHTIQQCTHIETRWGVTLENH